MNQQPAHIKVAAAQNVLVRAWGRRHVRITAVQPLQAGDEVKHHLLRCTLETSPDTYPVTALDSRTALPARDVAWSAGQVVPATVIVKCLGERSFGTPYRVDDLRPITEPWGLPTPAWAFFNEWAATTFLSNLSSEAPHPAPRCWGADSREGIVVLEDLGSSGVSLLELLMRGSSDVSSAGREAAEAALLSLAECSGRMHALTCGKEREYEAHWSSLADGRPRGEPGAARKAQAGELHRQWRQLKEVIGKRLGRDALPSALPGGSADAEIEAVAAMLEEPGPFLCLTHGENHPQNTHVYSHVAPAPAPGPVLQQTPQTAPATTALIDFEFAEFRHALMDGMFTRHLFPWRVYSIPEALQANMEQAYRAALVQGCPEAADDSLYAPAVIKARAAWMVFNLAAYLTEDGQSSASVWERDDPGQGVDVLPEGALAPPMPGVRQRVLLLLDAFARDSFAGAAATAAVTPPLQGLPALGTWAVLLAERLRRVWDVEAFVLSPYPVFFHSQ